MQSDGNLVLFTSGGTPVWATNTNNNNGAYLILQDDGNAVIYDTMGHSGQQTLAVTSSFN